MVGVEMEGSGVEEMIKKNLGRDYREVPVLGVPADGGEFSRVDAGILELFCIVSFASFFFILLLLHS